MAEFPRTIGDALILCNNMIAGYTANPLIFPNNTPLDVEAKRDLFVTASNAYTAARGAALAAAEQKENVFEALKELMVAELKISEVDTNNDFAKLALIGWAPRATPAPEPKPGEPRSLECTRQDYDTIYLDWKGPSAGTGGRVRSYVIQRQAGPGPTWEQAGIAIESEVILTGQPRGTDLRYRVVAVNLGGVSDPSPTIDIFL